MTTNLARATKVIDRTAEKVGTRAPLLAQALKRAHLAAATTPHRKGILTMHRTATIIVAGLALLAPACITHIITTDLRADGLRAHEERGNR